MTSKIIMNAAARHKNICNVISEQLVLWIYERMFKWLMASINQVLDVGLSKHFCDMFLIDITAFKILDVFVNLCLQDD